MQSDAKTVTEYLLDVPQERLAVLKKLRALCRKHLKGFKETMEYGMPSYWRDGVAEVGFASQKNFVALYILRTDVMNAHTDQLQGTGISHGKGCIRYSKPERVDFAVVESMLKATARSKGQVC
jgi:uncharacterized protein YdhG (YjbR/CyaY superfamily)